MSRVLTCLMPAALGVLIFHDLPLWRFFLHRRVYMSKCKGKTEVYTRVVGFMRPVQTFNKGKAEEYKDRQTFDTGKALKQ